jgi:hypothetical protein
MTMAFVLAAPPTSAAGGSAAAVGGTSAGSATPKGASKSVRAAPAVPRHTAPVTSRSLDIAYAGPVYEHLPTGQVVPYQPPATQAAMQAQLKTVTGGAAAAASPTAGAAKPQLLIPGHAARIVDGLAAAPMFAPRAVQEIVWAGNQIVGLPYIYGGGHASFSSPGYDCSGTVSFALHGASLLSTPEDSSELEGWGSRGVGAWVTLFSNPGHAYMTVAGLRLDTSSADDPSNQQGPSWRPLRPANPGFTVRHPTGL